MQGIAKPRAALSAAGSSMVLGPACLAASEASEASTAADTPGTAPSAPSVCAGAAGSGRVGRLPVNVPADLCGGRPSGSPRPEHRPAAALFHGWGGEGESAAPSAPHGDGLGPAARREVPGGRASTE